MSRYRIGDIVRSVDNINYTIEAVLVDNGEEISTYGVRYHDDGRFTSISDVSIVELVDEFDLSEDEEEQRVEQEEEQTVEGPSTAQEVGAVSPEPTPEPGIMHFTFNDVDDAETERRAHDRIQAIMIAQMPERVRKSRAIGTWHATRPVGFGNTEEIEGSPINRGIWEQIRPQRLPRERSLERNLVITDEAGQVPTNQPLADPFDGISEHMTVGVDTASVPEPIRQIVLLNRNNVSRRSVGLSDYNPRTGDDRTLIEFRLRDSTETTEITVTPIIHGSVYQFRGETGEEWVNQHSVPGFLNVMPRPSIWRDYIGQHWALRVDYDHFSNRPAGAPVHPDDLKSSYKRKKLRRKYPIPEIKEAKHYAGKEFIA